MFRVTGFIAVLALCVVAPVSAYRHVLNSQSISLSGGAAMEKSNASVAAELGHTDGGESGLKVFQQSKEANVSLRAGNLLLLGMGNYNPNHEKQKDCSHVQRVHKYLGQTYAGGFTVTTAGLIGKDSMGECEKGAHVDMSWKTDEFWQKVSGKHSKYDLVLTDQEVTKEEYWDVKQMQEVAKLLPDKGRFYWLAPAHLFLRPGFAVTKCQAYFEIGYDKVKAAGFEVDFDEHARLIRDFTNDKLDAVEEKDRALAKKLQKKLLTVYKDPLNGKLAKKKGPFCCLPRALHPVIYARNNLNPNLAAPPKADWYGSFAKGLNDCGFTILRKIAK